MPVIAQELRRITVDDMFAHGMPLFRRHHEEVGGARATLPLDIDWHRYHALESTDSLIAIGAFDGMGHMLGYSVAFLCRHLHSSQVLVAQSDVLYVRPEARRGGLGLRLIVETEKAAREEGAEVCIWHAKTGTALEAILPRIGYEPTESVFWRAL